MAIQQEGIDFSQYKPLINRPSVDSLLHSTGGTLIDRLQNPEKTTTVRRSLQEIHDARAAQSGGGVDIATTATTSSTSGGAKPKDKSFLEKTGDFVKGVGKSLVKNEVNFGMTLGTAFDNMFTGYEQKLNDEGSKQVLDMVSKSLDLAKNATDPAKKTRFLEIAKHAAEDVGMATNPVFKKTVEQIVGETAGVALDLATTALPALKPVAGGGAVIKGAESVLGIGTKLISPGTTSVVSAVLQGAAKVAKTSAIIGTAYGASNAMQDNKDALGVVGEAATSGAISGLIGAVSGGLAARGEFLAPAKAAALKQKAIDQYMKGLGVTKEKYKDMAGGITDDLLDQKWWGTRKQLLEKAEKGIKLSGDEYEKLGELKGVISTDGITEMIDKEMQGLTLRNGDVASVNLSRYKTLGNLKQDILATQLYDVGAHYTGMQEDLRQLAGAYGTELYDSRKAMKTINDSATLSQVKKVDSAIRSLLNTANPDYAKINGLYHMSSELQDILMETAKRESGGSATRSIIQHLGQITMAAAGGGAGGATFGVPGAVVGAAAIPAWSSVMNSAWYNTFSAVQKNALANRLLAKAPIEAAQAINYLAIKGAAYAAQLLSEDTGKE